MSDDEAFADMGFYDEDADEDAVEQEGFRCRFCSSRKEWFSEYSFEYHRRVMGHYICDDCKIVRVFVSPRLLKNHRLKFHSDGSLEEVKEIGPAPGEICFEGGLIRIFAFLSIYDLASCEVSCTYWRSISQSPGARAIWQYRLHQYRAEKLNKPVPTAVLRASKDIFATCDTPYNSILSEIRGRIRTERRRVVSSGWDPIVSTLRMLYWTYAQKGYCSQTRLVQSPWRSIEIDTKEKGEEKEEKEKSKMDDQDKKENKNQSVNAHASLHFDADALLVHIAYDYRCLGTCYLTSMTLFQWFVAFGTGSDLLRLIDLIGPAKAELYTWYSTEVSPVTAFFYACFYGNVETMQVLLDLDTRADAPQSRRYRSILEDVFAGESKDTTTYAVIDLIQEYCPTPSRLVHERISYFGGVMKRQQDLLKCCDMTPMHICLYYGQLRAAQVLYRNNAPFSVFETLAKVHHPLTKPFSFYLPQNEAAISRVHKAFVRDYSRCNVRLSCYHIAVISDSVNSIDILKWLDSLALPDLSPNHPVILAPRHLPFHVSSSPRNPLELFELSHAKRQSLGIATLSELDQMKRTATLSELDQMKLDHLSDYNWQLVLRTVEALVLATEMTHKDLQLRHLLSNFGKYECSQVSTELVLYALCSRGLTPSICNQLISNDRATLSQPIFGRQGQPISLLATAIIFRQMRMAMYLREHGPCEGILPHETRAVIDNYDMNRGREAIDIGMPLGMPEYGNCFLSRELYKIFCDVGMFHQHFIVDFTTEYLLGPKESFVFHSDHNLVTKAFRLCTDVQVVAQLLQIATDPFQHRDSKFTPQKHEFWALFQQWAHFVGNQTWEQMFILALARFHNIEFQPSLASLADQSLQELVDQLPAREQSVITGPLPQLVEYLTPQWRRESLGYLVPGRGQFPFEHKWTHFQKLVIPHISELVQPIFRQRMEYAEAKSSVVSVSSSSSSSSSAQDDSKAAKDNLNPLSLIGQLIGEYGTMHITDTWLGFYSPDSPPWEYWLDFIDHSLSKAGGPVPGARTSIPFDFDGKRQFQIATGDISCLDSTTQEHIKTFQGVWGHVEVIPLILHAPDEDFEDTFLILPDPSLKKHALLVDGIICVGPDEKDVLDF